MVIYYFTLQVMLPNPNMRPCVTAQGGWCPPKAFGNNRKQLERANDGSVSPWTLTFRHDGSLPMGQTTVGAQLPRKAKHFKTMSIYHNRGVLWAVPYDATKMQVGDGRDYGPGTTESDDDESGDESEEDNDDWAELSFAEVPNPIPSLSYAGLRKPKQRLLTHRANQQWAHHFLPDRYQSRTPAIKPQSGGMVGELPLLIALAALSQPQGQWNILLPQTIRHFGQGTPGWQVPLIQAQHVARGSNWFDPRGVVISVYIDPRDRETTEQDLDRYERGVYGPIFY